MFTPRNQKSILSEQNNSQKAEFEKICREKSKPVKNGADSSYMVDENDNLISEIDELSDIDNDEIFYTPNIIHKALSSPESSSSSSSSTSASSSLSTVSSSNKNDKNNKGESDDEGSFVFDLKTCIKYLHHCKLAAVEDLKAIENNWSTINKLNKNFAYLKENHLKSVEEKQQTINFYEKEIEKKIKIHQK